MRIINSQTIALIGVIIFLTLPVKAAEVSTTAPSAAPTTQPSSTGKVRFANSSALVPVTNAFPDPKPGDPNGSTRGQGDNGLILSALAPLDIGKTAQPSPVLYWHLSQPTDLPMVVSIIRRGDAMPLKRWPLDGTKTAGMHSIDLARESVHLEVGQTYEWVVAVVTDVQRRSKDVVAIGFVQRVAADPALEARTARIDPLEAAAMLSNSGLAYDALQRIVQAIDANPNEPEAQTCRADLLSLLKLNQTSSAETRQPQAN